MKSLFKKLFGPKARRFYLWSIIVVFSLIVLGYNVAKWRGARSWSEAQARLEKEGENHQLADIVPSAVPNDENFFGTEALLNIANPENEHVRERLTALFTFDREAHVAQPPKDSEFGAQTGAARNFGPWLDYAIGSEATAITDGDGDAARFLTALDALDPELVAELVAASSREFARVTPSALSMVDNKPLFELQLPHIQPLMALGRAMGLRTGAAAQSGSAEHAMNSLTILNRLADGLYQEPILISMLVGQGIEKMMIGGVWESLNAGNLDAGQLQQLQQLLAQHDTRHALLSALRGELLGALDIINYVEKSGPQAMSIIHQSNEGLPTAADRAIAAVMPSGWIDQNRATYANWTLDYMILPTRDGSFSEMLTSAQALEDRLVQSKETPLMSAPHQLIVSIAMPAMTSVVRKTIQTEAQRSLALTALALERHHQSMGSYPESLQELVPEFLSAVPLDPCLSSAQIQYRTAGERYLLWSAGNDGEDDGGSAGSSKASDPHYDGDWLWRYSAD